MTVFFSEPKFHAPEYFVGFLKSFSARTKYPFIGSKTCCQGLLNPGFLILINLFLSSELIVSGISLLGDQSPPPITLPALADATPIFFF